MNKTVLLLILATLLATNLCAKSIAVNVPDPDKFRIKTDEQVTELTLTGRVNKKVLGAIMRAYPNLEVLNMTNVKIVAYTDGNQVVYPENELPAGTFSRKEKIKIVLLPISITKIGKSAFWNCTGLQKVVLTDSIKVIDQFAFQLCSSLTQVTMPESITAIGGASFGGCTALKIINFKSKTPPTFPEWCPFPNLLSNPCVIYVPSEAVAAYTKTKFLNEFEIKLL